MKKIVSLMALCVVLLGAIMMVTGCGNKPDTSSVWKITGIDTKTTTMEEDGKEGKPVSGTVSLGNDPYYCCFHSDGKAYTVKKTSNGLEKLKDSDDLSIRALKDGYSFDAKTAKANIGEIKGAAYTVSDNKLTIIEGCVQSMKKQKKNDKGEYVYEKDQKEIKATIKLEKAVAATDPKEDEIKKVAK